MTGDEWQAIDAARRLLHLEERATLGEIKRAYRKMCKQHHPDTTGDESLQNITLLRELTQGYDLLMGYCDRYRIPLIPAAGENIDPEDWWMDRFGRDPLWGKKEGKSQKKG
jgi:hypothetical protein